MLDEAVLSSVASHIPFTGLLCHTPGAAPNMPCMLQDTARIESEMQDAVSAVQNPASALVTAAGQKRSAELAAAADSSSQLHIDKRVKLEV